MSRRMDRERVPRSAIQFHYNLRALQIAKAHAESLRLPGDPPVQPLYGFSVVDRFRELGRFRNRMFRFMAWSSFTNRNIRATLAGTTNTTAHVIRTRLEEKTALLKSWSQMRACDKPRLP